MEYEVNVPIAGHAIVIVEADNEEEAIRKAVSEVTLDNIEDWQAMERFNQGNFCFCPTPWEAEAEPTRRD